MLILQDSLDGKTWRNISQCGTDLTFSSKSAARAWIDLFHESNSLDWRVGFLLRCRDGRFFQVVHSNGKPVSY